MVMQTLLTEIRNCEVCQEYLPFPPRPIVSVSRRSQILIIGQAPGSKVQASGIPWDDPSGDLLREWLGLGKEAFYDPDICGIVPMGFCYPGKGMSGDLPPRPECAPLWHPQLFEKMSDVKLTLLIGQYAQRYYLGERAKRNLTETVRSFEEYLPRFFPLPHPSPRNRFWMAKNPWFQSDNLPVLRELVERILG